MSPKQLKIDKSAPGVRSPGPKSKEARRAELRKAIIGDLTENLISVVDDNLDALIAALGSGKFVSVQLRSMSKEEFEQAKADSEAQQQAVQEAIEAERKALEEGRVGEIPDEAMNKPLIEVVSH